METQLIAYAYKHVQLLIMQINSLNNVLAYVKEDIMVMIYKKHV